MRFLAACLALVLLGGCASEVGSDEEACETAHEVAREIDAGEAPAEQMNQWEFRLAEASVRATDHELSVALRMLADAASNIADRYEDDERHEVFDTVLERVNKSCK
ncbi:MAG: hypothetical protein Q4P33_09735 [Flaviflexus sp.]|nr:hypothetical protein [Flaviflexus sp.]